MRDALHKLSVCGGGWGGWVSQNNSAWASGGGLGFPTLPRELVVRESTFLDNAVEVEQGWACPPLCGWGWGEGG